MKFILFLLLFFNTLNADNLSYNRGEMIYLSKACTSCHGPDAEGSTQYPALANKKSEYLEKKLHYFKKGNVNTQSREMMVQFIINLSEKNIQDLVFFLSNHKEKKRKDVSYDLLGGNGS
ncbi:MAG: c-type cytochrome [Sulfurimonas sp.]